MILSEFADINIQSTDDSKLELIKSSVALTAQTESENG